MSVYGGFVWYILFWFELVYSVILLSIVLFCFSICYCVILHLIFHFSNFPHLFWDGYYEIDNVISEMELEKTHDDMLLAKIENSEDVEMKIVAKKLVVTKI